jgi:hypothetical protein
MSQRPPDDAAPAERETTVDAAGVESELPPESPAAPDPPPDRHDPGAPGTLSEDAQAVLAAVSAVLRTQVTHFRALKRLFLEEFALARDAIVASLVFLLGAMLLFATAYALLTALLVLGLRWTGLPWAVALLLPLAISAALGWFAFSRARALFRYADFESTRRQLERGLTVPKEAETEE